MSSEKKIEFHTDGVVNKNLIGLPEFLMLQNLSIRYKSPGNLYWLPFSKWNEKNFYMKKIGVGRKYKIELTPKIYENNFHKFENAMKESIVSPVFFDNEIYDFPLFLNGRVFAAEGNQDFDMEIFNDLQKSFLSNTTLYRINQKESRLIFLANLRGVHARDKFNDPMKKTEYARILIRSVSENFVN